LYNQSEHNNNVLKKPEMIYLVFEDNPHNNKPNINAQNSEEKDIVKDDFVNYEQSDVRTQSQHKNEVHQVTASVIF